MQRVPETESQGRIHTSTVTVAVLPEPEELDVKVNPEELRIDVFRSSGPGGQHVNTTDSAVRITHIPTGLVVTCQDEKSQHKNKAKAIRVLRARLKEKMEEEKEQEVSDERRKQVGTGDRSERIRTYNFPQGRVTDHRVGLTLYKLEDILAGDLDPLLDPTHRPLSRQNPLNRGKPCVSERASRRGAGRPENRPPRHSVPRALPHKGTAVSPNPELPSTRPAAPPYGGLSPSGAGAGRWHTSRAAKEFFSEEFLVDERVLVPRPETEIARRRGAGTAREATGSRPYSTWVPVPAPSASSWPSRQATGLCPSIYPRDALAVARRNMERLGVRERVDLLCGPTCSAAIKARRGASISSSRIFPTCPTRHGRSSCRTSGISSRSWPS